MFHFIVKHFGFLKAFPLLLHLLDSFLQIGLLVISPKLSNSFDELEAEVLTWEGTSISMHKYGGVQFNCEGKELGHLHSNGLLDVLFTRKISRKLIAEGKAMQHHVFVNSGWISFYLTQPADKEYALMLLKMSYLRLTQPLI